MHHVCYGNMQNDVQDSFVRLDFVSLADNISHWMSYDLYDTNPLNQLTYSFVTSYAVNDKFNAYIEPYGEINEVSQHLGKINLGFTYLIKENMQFDYSLGSGINHIFNFTSIGYSILFN